MDGQNLLSLATEFSLSCLEILLKHFSKETFIGSSKDNSGRSALHLAAANSSRSAVELLVANDFKSFIDQDIFGNTPFHIACLKGIKSK